MTPGGLVAFGVLVALATLAAVDLMTGEDARHVQEAVTTPASEVPSTATIDAPPTTAGPTTTRLQSLPTRARVVVLTNPLDIRYRCEQVALHIIGRSFTDAEAGELVAAYQDLERTAQEPGSTVRAPTVEAFCMSWIPARFPEDQQRHSFGKVADAFFDIINNPRVGARPATTATLPGGGVCHGQVAGRHEYQAPTFGSCPLGWELLR